MSFDLIPLFDDLNSTFLGDEHNYTKCIKLNIIAMFCILLFILCVFFNTILLVTFCRFKDLRGPLNMFIMWLTILNLIGSVVELPVVIINNFFCKWVFRRIGCVMSGFLVFFIGTSSIYIMCAISFERFFIMHYPKDMKKMNKKICAVILQLCFLLALLWASLPLLGWSYYSLEASKTTCSVKWDSSIPNVKSFNITIFICVFFIPLIFILFTNVKLVVQMRKSHRINLTKFKNRIVKSKITVERKITVGMMLVIVFFVISWLPYSMVSMYAAFIDANGLNNILGVLPAVFAKFSFLWTSLLYIFIDEKIRKRMFSLGTNYNPSVDFNSSKSFSHKRNSAKINKERQDLTI